jgi:MFS transporter, DHA1 family, multidrug resistance protein
MLHIAFFRRSTASSWQALVGAICLAQAAAIVGFDFTLPFIPLYLQHNLGVHGLAQTALWAGLIGFGPAIPATIFGPLWGRVADRFGYRTMLLRAMLSASLILGLMGLAPSPGILLCLRMVQGALTGTTFAAQALVAAAVPEKETGRAMGLLQMSVFAGATLGPLGGGAVADLLGYRATYAVAGALLAVATIIVVAFVHEPTRRIAPGEAKAESSRPSLRSVLAVPAFASALILTLTVQLASTAQFPVIPLYVKDLLHSSQNVASDTGWLLAAAGLVAGAGSYLAGRLQRRVGLKRLLAVSVVMTSLLLLPQAFVGNYLSLLVVRCVAAFALGGMLSLVGTLAAVSSPANAKGTAFGLMGAASSMGFGAGPLIGGSLVGVVGIRSVFVLSAIVLGLVPAAVAGWSAAPGARRVLRTGPRAVLRLLPQRE